LGQTLEGGTGTGQVGTPIPGLAVLLGGNGVTGYTNTMPASIAALLSGNAGSTARDPCDPFWGDVLLYMSGAGAAWTDSSSYARGPAVGVGNAAFDTTHTLFGNPTYNLPAATDRVTLSDVFLNQLLGANEWCYEFWIRPTVVPLLNNQVISAMGPFTVGLANDFTIWLNVPNIGGGSYTQGSTSSLSTTNFTHVAFVRDNTTDSTFGYIKTFVNGQLESTGGMFQKTASIPISNNEGFKQLYGYFTIGPQMSIVETRITYKTARYYANFDVPTGPYPTVSCRVLAPSSTRSFTGNYATGSLGSFGLAQALTTVSGTGGVGTILLPSGPHLTKLQTYFDGNDSTDISYYLNGAGTIVETGTGSGITITGNKFHFYAQGTPSEGGYMEWNSAEIGGWGGPITIEWFAECISNKNLAYSRNLLYGYNSADLAGTSFEFGYQENVGYHVLEVGGTTYTYGAAAGNGRTHHAFVFGSTQRRYYIDGVLEYSSTASPPGVQAGGIIRLDGTQYNNNEITETTIDEFRIRYEEVYTGSSFTPPTNLPAPD